MRVTETSLPGVLLIEPNVHGDERGVFFEVYHARRYLTLGISEPFVQDNYSRSIRNTLRGLHFQEPHAQGKLVQVIHGSVFDVAVDIRRGSPVFGRWYAVDLSEENKRQLWIPPGFAHGFCVTSDVADFIYKCTDYYVPEADRGIAWDDPQLAIAWPTRTPLLSGKDARAPRLSAAPVLPIFTAK